MIDLTKDLKVYFYTTASEKKGYGHLIRQSLISKKLKNKNIKNYLLLDDVPVNFIKKNKLFNLSKFYISDLLAQHNIGDNLLIIIDRYNLSLNIQKKIKKKKIKTITYDNIDNVSSKFIISDIIININPTIKKKDYDLRSLNKKTKIFTGLKYALVKCNKLNKLKKQYHFLVILGGGNNLKTFKKIISAFENNFENKKILIVLGYKNKNLKIKKKLINNYIFKNNVKNLNLFMECSKNILCAGGTVLLESMTHKISRNVIITANNQKKIVEYFFKKKLVNNYIQEKSNIDYKDFIKSISKQNYKIRNLPQNFFDGTNKILEMITKYT